MTAEKRKRGRPRKKNLTVAEKYAAMYESAVDSREKLESLGVLSEKLGALVGCALDDKSQFNRFIVSEKCGKDGTTESVEQGFSKVDFKSVKEAAGASTARADPARSIWSTPDLAGLCGVVERGGESAADPGITEPFESGEEYSE